MKFKITRGDGESFLYLNDILIAKADEYEATVMEYDFIHDVISEATAWAISEHDRLNLIEDGRRMDRMERRKKRDGH